MFIRFPLFSLSLFLSRFRSKLYSLPLSVSLANFLSSLSNLVFFTFHSLFQLLVGNFFARWICRIFAPNGLARPLLVSRFAISNVHRFFFVLVHSFTFSCTGPWSKNFTFIDSMSNLCGAFLYAKWGFCPLRRVSGSLKWKWIGWTINAGGIQRSIKGTTHPLHEQFDVSNWLEGPTTKREKESLN